METYKTEFVVKKWKASNAEGVSLHEGNKNCTSCVKSEKKKKQETGGKWEYLLLAQEAMMNRAVTLAKPLTQSPREAEFSFSILTLRLQYW